IGPSSNAGGGGGGGVCNASGLNGTSGFGGAGSSTGAPTETPARGRADLTMEIKGSGGTNGFFKTPSAPTGWASSSSKGSNAPTSRITGIWERAESSFTYLQTS